MSLALRSRTLLAAGVVAALLGSGLAAAAPQAAIADTADYAALVNTFVSTEDDFGQDLVGAEAPNSIVKINPMTVSGRSHSGYDYAEDQIAGFTHTNLNGVGGSGGGGDLLVVPTYETYSSRPSTESYAKTFSHDAEEASPGYYSVDLQTGEGAIRAEATTDVRTGQDRFTFPAAGSASLVVDLRNNFTSRKGASLDVAMLDDGRASLAGDFTGHFNGYDYTMYYYVETTDEVGGVRTWGSDGSLGDTAHRDGTDIGAVIDVDVAAGEQVGLTVAVSPISVEQARIDMAAEMGGRSFDEVREQTHADWNALLGRVAVTASATSDPDGDLQELFYTHLYRMFGSPMNATSTSGTYRGLDGQVHDADGYVHYDGWGFWDDFRKYEVLAIAYPDVFGDMAQSIVDLYASFANSGASSLSSVTHSVPTVRFERAAVVVADAIAKGAHLDGLSQAWPALVSQSQGGYANEDNERRGYVANEVDDTLGTAYDDWAMATIADALGKSDEAGDYRLRAANWTNLYKDGAVTLADGEKTGLIFPKDGNGSWVSADPERFEAGNVYQGTLWQYHWYAAPDMGGLIEKMGGEETARSALSFLFGEQAPDDGTRMLHSNANEIDLQAPYLFNYVGAPSKTQYWVRSIYTKETWNRYIATGSTHEYPSGGGEFTPPIKTKVFTNTPQGFLPTMDNDTGTMSSTFVSAALGLFPVLAGSDEYQIGTPFFENVRIAYPTGRTLDISADGVSPEAFYVQSATLNGEPFDRTWVTYDQLTAGGELAFVMGEDPSDWAADSVASSSLSDELPSSVYDPISAISVSSREFHEASAGDGTIDGTIELRIANGTFAGSDGDDLSAAITAEGLPAGLALVATRTGARTASLALAGAAAESAPLDSIDDLTVKISDAAFSRKPSNGTREFALKVSFDDATVRADATRLKADDDGAIDASVTLTVSGAGFAGASGRDLISDGALSLAGLPETVSASAIVQDASTVVLSLGGSLGDARRASFALNFTDAAFDGATAAAVRGDGISGLGSFVIERDQRWRQQLDALAAEAALVVRGSYSAASFDAFDAARGSADDVLANAAATDDELRAAFETLERTAGALEIEAVSARVRVEAETYDADNGGGLKKEGGDAPVGNVGGTWDGGMLEYRDRQFGSEPLTHVTVSTSTRDERVGDNRRLEFYLDEVSDASRIGSVELPKTGGWDRYVETTAALDEPVSDDHTLIVVMRTDSVAGQEYAYVSNLQWFEFGPDPAPADEVDLTALNDTIAAAEPLRAEEERYVSFDFAVFLGALERATVVAAAGDVTQERADEAQRVLDLATAQLEWRPVRQLPLLIARAEAVDPGAHAADDVAAVTAALDAARAVGSDASYEEFAEAARALDAALAALGDSEDPDADLDVSVEAFTRVVAGKQYVSVRVINGAGVAVDLVVDTAYGSKAFAGVQPGESASVSVNSRLTAVPAGEATVTVMGEVDGEAVTVAKSAAYDAAG
jgi:predicted alpha-1,2-mannosidase